MFNARRSSRRIAAAIAVLIIVIAGVAPATAAPHPTDQGAHGAAPELLKPLGEAGKATSGATLARVGADGKPIALDVHFVNSVPVCFGHNNG